MPGFRPLILVALATLAGCVSGVEPGGKFPSATFDVAADYTAAYRRASEYVRVCHEQAPHRYDVAYAANRSLVDKTATGEISVFKTTEPAKLLEVVRAKPNGPRTAEVTVTVLGDGTTWDAEELAAAKQSIQTATPVCRAGQE